MTTDKSPAPHHLVITRRFRALPETVFDAWLDPAAVGSWLFATPGGVMQRIELDARVGGGFVIAEQRGDELAEHFGTYLEIDRPHRLVFTFATEPGETPSQVTVEVAPTADGCELTLTQEVHPEWAQYADRVREGWTSILEGLDTAMASRAITLTRLLDAPRERVFRAWTEAAHFARWFGPHSVDVPFCQMDPRPGGEIRFCHRLPEQGDLWVQGTFQEVTEPARLVFTLAFTDEAGRPASHPMIPDWPLEARIVTAVSLLEQGGKTALTIRQTIEPAAAAAGDAVGREREMAKEGWGETLDRLEDYLYRA